MKNISKILFVTISCFFTVNIEAQNPIIRNIFTADPAPLVHKGILYLYTGHDVATQDDTNYKMADWHVFSTTNMKDWKDHGVLLSPSAFSWATGDAYARSMHRERWKVLLVCFDIS
ncbi:hypothetical protein [Flavobacterium ginsengisoli]|uniref:hypothetical protein n=1 Tax=Flavobacterium ginsengisoli TaxID=871694 RepID=UPI0024151A3B|nr:hypothetical protein [Flavobacterium ginsengisoli]